MRSNKTMPSKVENRLENVVYLLVNTINFSIESFHLHTFFFWALKFSMMTPMNRLRVKKEPNTMKMTKYM